MQKRNKKERSTKSRRNGTVWMHYTMHGGSGNRCKLFFEGRTLTYDLKGFMELSRTGPAEGSPLSIRVLRLEGSLIDGAACGAPERIWLYPATAQRDISGEPSVRDGLITAATALSLVIESRDPGIDLPIEARSHGFAAAPFALVQLHASVTLGVVNPILVFRATGPGESPYGHKPIGADILLCCGPSFFNEPQCLEFCLHIKIAVDDDVPLVEAKDVKKTVAGANKLLGCDPPGQCCIRLSIGGIVAVYTPQIPLEVDGSKVADVVAVTKLERVDPKTGCYNVYVVKSIAHTAGGVTAWGTAGKDGTLIDMDAATSADGQILAHELGHALGLARGGGNNLDANGIDAHSNDPKNVMSGVNQGGPPGDQFNALQCSKMRSSPHLVSVGPACRDRPKGPVYF